MRWTLPCSRALCVLFLASILVPAARARPVRPGGILDAQMAPISKDLSDDLPARAPDGFMRADTVNFGYFQVIGGAYYAVQGETWTWDHGSSNVAEGWYAIDETINPTAYFRQITASTWAGDPNNPLPPPIITGTGSAWLGLFESEARALCWASGLGYGNMWCQRITSPQLTYDGSGEVTLSLKYFADSELDFDYTTIYFEYNATSYPLNGSGFSGHRGAPNTPLTFTRSITNADFGGGSAPVPFRIIIEFSSDAGVSDQDGDWSSAYGPFGMDDVTLTSNLVGGNAAYNFDANLQSWTPSTCPAIGSYWGIADVGNYVIQDPCACTLTGNIIEYHDANLHHPVKQLEGAFAPPADRTNLQSYNKIFVDYDVYAELPYNNGVWYRPGFNYYPLVCPATGASLWSGRQGRAAFFYSGEAPVCGRGREVGTDWGIPANCDLIGVVMEVYSSCDAFGIPPTRCTGQTNFTPVFDNIRLRMTGVPDAPVVDYDTGLTYTDGFGQGLILSTTDPGNADAVLDLHRDNPVPDRLGDSLVVVGPSVNADNRFQCKLWLRVRREGPGAASIPGYTTWKERIRDGLNITGPSGAFTFAWMDSVEIPAGVYSNKFYTHFAEQDDDRVLPDTSPANAIIPDHILAPGTKIEYFVTAAYTCKPTVYYCRPDTAGRNYFEFEILPSYRNVGGVSKFPCVLYVDAYQRPVVTWYVQNALNVVLNGAGPGAPIPDPATWDRYDYQDASSNWHGPLFRNVGGNAGASMAQMLGYRMIMVTTGMFGSDCMEARDWMGFGDWLGAVACNSNLGLQGFYANGDNVSQAIAAQFPTFLSTYCGAYSVCDGYNQPGCPNGDENDENYCVRLDYVNGGPFQPSVPLDVWGNWCPPQFFYDVIGAIGGGAGNKKYHKVGSAATVNYAQVVNDASSSGGRFRTVIDGYSVHHLAKRDLEHPGGETECPSDSASVVEAAYNEIREVIKWTLGISNPGILSDLCVNPCDVDGIPDASGADASRVYRLDQNSPNPFNPRTTISYALAAAGPAKLTIFDASGRVVRTLVDEPQTAGRHEVVWDGSDNGGRRVAAGIYWTRLTAGEYRSNRKMVVLR